MDTWNPRNKEGESGKFGFLSVSISQAINGKWLHFTHIRATDCFLVFGFLFFVFFCNPFPISNVGSSADATIWGQLLVSKAVGQVIFFVLQFNYGLGKPHPDTLQTCDPNYKQGGLRSTLLLTDLSSSLLWAVHTLPANNR